jgi:hypothetical protein
LDAQNIFSTIQEFFSLQMRAYALLRSKTRPPDSNIEIAVASLN